MSYDAEDVVLSEAFRNFSTLLFCERYRCLYLQLGNICFAILSTVEMPDIENKSEIRGLISFCGAKSLPQM